MYVCMHVYAYLVEVQTVTNKKIVAQTPDTPTFILGARPTYQTLSHTHTLLHKHTHTHRDGNACKSA